MKAELKTKWVEALRSGKYQQGKHSLRNHSGYCCLGVLADVIDPNWEPYDHSTVITSEGVVGDKVLYKWMKQKDGDSCYLRLPEVEKELPIAEQNRLAGMNDHGKTFSEIADYIETNIKGE